MNPDPIAAVTPLSKMSKFTRVDGFATLWARRFALFIPCGYYRGQTQKSMSVKNDLDRWRWCGRDVSDGGIPHGFHTNDRVKLHHPAQPRKTRDAKNAMKSRNEAKCAGGEPYPPSCGTIFTSGPLSATCDESRMTQTGFPARIPAQLTRRPGPMTRKRKRRSSVVEIGNRPARVTLVAMIDKPPKPPKPNKQMLDAAKFAARHVIIRA